MCDDGSDPGGTCILPVLERERAPNCLAESPTSFRVSSDAAQPRHRRVFAISSLHPFFMGWCVAAHPPCYQEPETDFPSSFSTALMSLLSVFALDSSLVMAAVGLSERELAGCSVEHAALVGGDHVLNVNERIVAAVLLEKLKRCLDKVTEVGGLALRVVDLVSKVLVAHLEEVEDGEDLTVVGHESLTNGVTASHQLL